MENQNTIPSPLGPVTTIPAPLIPGADPPAANAGKGPSLWFRLLLTLCAVVLVVYFVG